MAKTSHRELLKGLADIAATLRRNIESEVDGFSPDPQALADRRAVAMRDYRYFAKTYFPHYVKHGEAALHSYLYSRLPEIVGAVPSPRDYRPDGGPPTGHSGRHEAIAAPRGNAKSTLVTQIFVIWCLVTGRKKYPVIIMDALDQALPMLESIKAELEYNPRLSMDFPEATGPGRVWQTGSIVTKNDAKVQVFGSGKRMRGLRHGPHRPDLVIGDDLENDENVRSPEQRDKLQSWLTKTVLSLGPADDSMDVIIIGTILHYDSVLNRLLNNPLWSSKKFKSIERWPDNMYLWERWEGILRDEGEAAAQAFYDDVGAAPSPRPSRPEGGPPTHPMEAGSIVCWPDGQPLYKLMVKRARDGRAAFDSEQQNDPVSSDDAPFAALLEPSPLGRGQGGGCFWTELPPNLIYFGACDPSLGKHGGSRDPSALLVGGLDRSAGILYVVEAPVKKRLPDRIIEDVISLHDKWHCALWVVEAVQFQEFFRTELVKRSAQRGRPVPARAVTPATDKLLRIETLQPHMANGLIKLHPSQTTLIDQLRHFPKADHDDGPDALHMLWMAATTGGLIGQAQSAGARIGSSGAEITNSGWGTLAGAQDLQGYL
ncbi:MAG: phage terminase large subunit [Sulfuricellaceae bacterium]|nr:phage terminase large subunit [Sulfuricellaceae bacterium]